MSYTCKCNIEYYQGNAVCNKQLKCVYSYYNIELEKYCKYICKPSGLGEF